MSLIRYLFAYFRSSEGFSTNNMLFAKLLTTDTKFNEDEDEF